MIHQGQKPIDALQILVKSLVVFGIISTNYFEVLDHFVGFTLKGLMIHLDFSYHMFASILILDQQFG